jgi:hypothetical protein
VDFTSNFCPTIEICALRPSFLHTFALIWHHAFVPCTQLIALYALRRAPNFYEIAVFLFNGFLNLCFILPRAP